MELAGGTCKAEVRPKRRAIHEDTLLYSTDSGPITMDLVGESVRPPIKE